MKRKNAIEPQVEALINKFFATLKHTAGAWVCHNHFEAVVGNGHKVAILVTQGGSARPYTEHDCKLIARSPEMLYTICRTYLTLLIQFEYGQNETLNLIRISLNGTLADLSNKISSATGLENKFIQETFESMAKEVI